MSARNVYDSGNVSEKELAKVADKAVKNEGDGIIKGKPLPKDFVNPEIGTMEHRCLDPQGRYQPEWKQLFIVKTDQTGTYQWFADWRVAVNQWVDVPNEVAEIITSCVYEEVEQNVDAAAALAKDYVPRTVRKIPRFNYRILPSA